MKKSRGLTSSRRSHRSLRVNLCRKLSDPAHPNGPGIGRGEFRPSSMCRLREVLVVCWFMAGQLVGIRAVDEVVQIPPIRRLPCEERHYYKGARSGQRQGLRRASDDHVLPQAPTTPTNRRRTDGLPRYGCRAGDTALHSRVARMSISTSVPTRRYANGLVSADRRRHKWSSRHSWRCHRQCSKRSAFARAQSERAAEQRV